MEGAGARVISLGKEAARSKHHQTEPFSLHEGMEAARRKELESNSAPEGLSVTQTGSADAEDKPRGSCCTPGQNSQGRVHRPWLQTWQGDPEGERAGEA